MKNLFRILLFFLLSSLFVYAGQIKLTQKEKEYIQNNTPIIVYGHNSFPPFNYSENTKGTGYTHDYMKLVSKYTGIDFEFTKPQPWGEAIQLFKDGKIDILPHVAKNKSREAYIDYTDFNHLEYLIGITVRKGQEINSMDDLKDKVIAVVNKSFLHTFLKTNYINQKLLTAPATSDAISLVSSGKADAFIGSVPMMEFYIQKSWYNNLETKTIEGLGIKDKVFMPMGVRKGNEELKSILEKANQIIPYTELLRLKEKWLEINNTNRLLLNEEEQSYLSKKKDIKYCVLPDTLPLGKINEKGKAIGIGPDILEVISKRIKKDFVLVSTNSWSESIQNIRDRKCDIIPIAVDIPSRHDTMNFTKPYITEPFVIATSSEKLFIRDEKELSNKKIGIVEGYAFIEILKARNPLIKIVEVKNTKDGLERVIKGDIFAYVDTIPTISYIIQKHGLYKVKIAGKLNYNIPISIASRNDEPLLNSILQKSLNEIPNEEIDKINRKWIEIRVQQEFDYQKLFYIIVFFSLVFIIGFYKNRSINLINKKLEKANYEILENQKMVDKYVLILTTNLNGEIISVNDAYCQAVGFERKELIGKKVSYLFHPDLKDDFLKNISKSLVNNGAWTGEIKNITKDKETLYFRVVIESLFDENKNKIGYRSISEDITDKKRIEELSVTDSLTKLSNRLKIDDILEKQVDIFYRYKTPFSIILLDLDSFKSINDTYGHDIGDYALKTVAKLVRENVRKTDEVGRWGGEEFIIICSNTLCDNSFILAENIRKAIENYHFKKIGKLTISLGVTEFRDNDTINSLFKRVDNCLYDAKKTGKNKTVKV